MSAEPLHLIDPSSEFDGPALPSDAGAEQMVIGAMLLSAEAVQAASELLRPDDFYDPRHHVIYTTILEMVERGEPTDAQAVAGRIIDAGRVRQVGGDLTFLHRLIQDVPSVVSTAYYAKRVLDLSRRRQLIEVSVRVRQMAFAPSTDTDVVMDKAAEAFQAVTVGHSTLDVVPFAELIGQAVDVTEEAGRMPVGPLAIPTGVRDLDALLGGGLRTSQFAVIAGRPGMGKSVACFDVARAAAKRGIPALIFSLEMSRIEAAHRLLAAECGIPIQNWRNGTMGPEDWGRFEDRIGRLAEMPIYINDDVSLSTQGIFTATRQAQRRYGIKLVIIDYLQLVQVPPGAESRQQGVAENSRRCKNGAKEQDVAVIAACQLNRGNTARADKRPMMSDLRESGEIENAADVIVLLHREDYYDKESLRSGEIDLIVDKNRHGPQDTITAAAQLQYSRIADLAV